MEKITKILSPIAALLLLAIIIATALYFIKDQKHRAPIPGTIVLLNGTSASGKSSIMRALKKIYGDSWVFLIGDEFLETYTVEYPMPESMAEPVYQRQILSALCMHAKELSLEGKNVFVELVDFDDHYEHYCSILDCAKIVKILVYCPPDVMVDRVEKRNKAGEQKAYLNSSMTQFRAIYKLQESADELVVDHIKTDSLKYSLEFNKKELRKLMKEAGVTEEDIEKNINLVTQLFIEQFKLDTLKEIVLVPKHKWDLIVNTGIHSPEEIAKTISEFLEKRKENAMHTQQHSSGTFLAKDKLGSPVILKWIKTNIQSLDYAAGMRNIAEIASQAFATVELQFLQAHPEAVMQDEYLKQYIPFFEKGPEAVDWNAVENKIQSNLKQMHEMDLSAYGPDVLKPYINDIYFFVMVKDQVTEAPLGYINFSIAPDYAAGDIKVTGIGIAPFAQNRGLGKLLMSSIFKIAPQIQRIFLSTRVTNDNAIRAYRSWGFTTDLNPVQEPNSKIIKEHWSFMEYKTGASNVLQNMAASLRTNI